MRIRYKFVTQHDQMGVTDLDWDKTDVDLDQIANLNEPNKM